MYVIYKFNWNILSIKRFACLKVMKVYIMIEKLSPPLPGFQKFYYCDSFLLNKKSVFWRFSIIGGFSTIDMSTIEGFYCTVHNDDLSTCNYAIIVQCIKRIRKFPSKIRLLIYFWPRECSWSGSKKGKVVFVLVVLTNLGHFPIDR